MFSERFDNSRKHDYSFSGSKVRILHSMVEHIPHWMRNIILCSGFTTIYSAILN